MDYPFYLRKCHQLPLDTVRSLVDMLGTESVEPHPHFPDASRNENAFKHNSPRVNDAVGIIADSINHIVPKTNLYWSEINVLGPQGKLGEHSDLAYAGYNKEGGMPMEVVLTHKIHIHLCGDSQLSFRRSKYESAESFVPEVGECFWYNNYVLHESKNTGEANRMAVSLIYWDRQWRIKAALYKRMNLTFQQIYQL